LFVLIDSRIGPKDSDLELMDFCDQNGICYQIVYTKKDKRIREKTQIELSHENHPAMLEKVLETSAEKKYGLEDLRETIGVK
jgi:GTP-binding protein EngB required for normal cell division